MFTIPVDPDNVSLGGSKNIESDPQLLSGLVHDLRQPLSVIQTCADFLNLVLPQHESRARQQVELLRQQVDDANRLLCAALGRARA